MAIDFEKVKLGKKDYKHDGRTLMMARFFQPNIPVPTKFSVDANRAPFPNNLWGNDAYGDCVLADRANASLRLERIEQRITIKLTDDIVINKYKEMTGCQEPEDENDTGLVMLDAMRDWRSTGWNVSGKNYTIYAFGELDPLNSKQLRMGAFVLAGLHFGFALPAAIQGASEWVYNGETGSDWRPGSWGGHAVYGFAYSSDGFTVKSWGQNIFVNNAFIEKFADEVWVVVDRADSWRTKQTIDVAKLDQELHAITQQTEG